MDHRDWNFLPDPALPTSIHAKGEPAMKRMIFVMVIAAITAATTLQTAMAAPIAPVPLGASPATANIIPVYYYHGRYYRHRWHGHYYPYYWHGRYYHHRYYRYHRYHYW
jgi:hypothetical protein